MNTLPHFFLMGVVGLTLAAGLAAAKVAGLAVAAAVDFVLATAAGLPLAGATDLPAVAGFGVTNAATVFAGAGVTATD
jgi:hypothetical protein